MNNSNLILLRFKKHVRYTSINMNKIEYVCTFSQSTEVRMHKIEIDGEYPHKAQTTRGIMILTQFKNKLNKTLGIR